MAALDTRSKLQCRRRTAEQCRRPNQSILGQYGPHTTCFRRECELIWCRSATKRRTKSPTTMPRTPPVGSAVDFSQFRLRPISTSANFWMLNFGITKGGPKRGSPNLEKVWPEGWKPKPRKSVGRRVGPEGWGAQNFALFFSLSRHCLHSFLPLLGSSRRILRRDP